jgi:hypothetical protein
MAIIPVGNGGIAPGRSGEAPARPETTEAPELTARKRQNLAILQASEQVSLKSGNRSLALVFTAAIDAINKELAPELGDNAIQRAHSDGLDVSPEATAERIVSLTTGLFSRFQAHRPELGPSQQVERFMELITSGIERGFAEAREVLDGLGVLEGEIATNIDRTFERVQEGLAEFRERMLGETGNGPEAAASRAESDAAQ